MRTNSHMQQSARRARAHVEREDGACSSGYIALPEKTHLSGLSRTVVPVMLPFKLGCYAMHAFSLERERQYSIGVLAEIQVPGVLHKTQGVLGHFATLRSSTRCCLTALMQ